jgi:hypothetical protein
VTSEWIRQIQATVHSAVCEDLRDRVLGRSSNDFAMGGGSGLCALGYWTAHTGHTC